MSKTRLTKDDWLAAGFRALALRGPSALRAEALARELDTTKGSFYWHFKDLPAFKADMLGLWQEKVAGEIINEVQKVSEPKARFRSLMNAASQAAPEQFGGRAIEPAMRAWALTDDDVLAVLKKVDEKRISFLDQLLEDLGHSTPDLGRTIYGAYIGLDDLESKGSGTVKEGFEALFTLLTR